MASCGQFFEKGWTNNFPVIGTLLQVIWRKNRGLS